ncbi:heterokaryon incompatibility protein-domain-containing protein [Annulohypoxylon moriforme]|nr:heterokaryon incompatibility protein-domain-containing protein [Annulohypoxylon moriforme]
MTNTTLQSVGRLSQSEAIWDSSGGLSALNAHAYTYHLRQTGDHPEFFIRLLTVHPGSETDPIHLELLPEPVDLRHTTYEALSYVWGSEDDLVVVKFGRRGVANLFITQNLAEALMHLRYPDRPRTIWIDAICINQMDNAEKSTQVAMMGQIYSNATSVIAWLGPEADNSKRALELVGWIGRQVVVDWSTIALTPAQDSTYKSLANVQEPLPCSRDESAWIISLLDRPWFKRLWVRQEVYLARNATVQVGMDSLPWDDFKNAGACLYSKYRQQTIGPEWIVTRDVFHACDARRYQLNNLTGRLRSSNCKDPRDRIYGIMSMLHESESNVQIIPDYSAPIAEVYQRVVLEHIKQHETLTILHECGGTQSSSIPNLPSWVPDWCGSKHTILWPISSAADCFPAIIKHLGHGALQVSGIRCGVVTQTSIVRGGPFASREVIEDIQRLRKIIPLKGKESKLSGDNDVLDGLVNALFLGRFRESYRPLHGGWPSRRDARDWIADIFASDDPSISVKPHGFVGNLRPGRVFITDTGGIGLGPSEVRENDIVALLVGGLTPCLLKPQGEDGKFLLLGNCFAPGNMFGEPLLGPLPEGYQQVLTSIRSDGSSINGWAVAYTDLATDEIIFEDPRLGRLGVDLQQYRDNWSQAHRPLIRLDQGDWQKAGVTLEEFTLI